MVRATPEIAIRAIAERYQYPKGAQARDRFESLMRTIKRERRTDADTGEWFYIQTELEKIIAHISSHPNTDIMERDVEYIRSIIKTGNLEIDYNHERTYYLNTNTAQFIDSRRKILIIANRYIIDKILIKEAIGFLDDEDEEVAPSLRALNNITAAKNILEILNEHKSGIRIPIEFPYPTEYDQPLPKDVEAFQSDLKALRKISKDGLISSHLKLDDDEKEKISVPDQVPGPHFSIIDGKLTLTPPEWLDKDGNNLAILDGLHEPLCEAVDDLIEDLSKGNIPHARLLDLTEKYRREISKELNQVNFSTLHARGARLKNAEGATQQDVDKGDLPLLDSDQMEALASVLQLHDDFMSQTEVGQSILAEAERSRRTVAEHHEFDKATTELIQEVAKQDFTDQRAADYLNELATLEADPEKPRSQPERTVAWKGRAAKNLTIVTVSASAVVAGVATLPTALAAALGVIWLKGIEGSKPFSEIKKLIAEGHDRIASFDFENLDPQRRQVLADLKDFSKKYKTTIRRVSKSIADLEWISAVFNDDAQIKANPEPNPQSANDFTEDALWDLDKIVKTSVIRAIRHTKIMPTLTNRQQISNIPEPKISLDGQHRIFAKGRRQKTEAIFAYCFARLFRLFTQTTDFRDFHVFFDKMRLTLIFKAVVINDRIFALRLLNDLRGFQSISKRCLKSPVYIFIRPAKSEFVFEFPMDLYILRNISNLSTSKLTKKFKSRANRSRHSLIAFYNEFDLDISFVDPTLHHIR